MSTLSIVGLTPETWKAFLECRAAQKSPLVHPPEQAVLIASPDGLVAGVCVYDTKGPWMLFEHMTTNPEASSEDRASAMSLVVELGVQLALSKGKVPLVATRVPHLEELLAQFGFSDSGLKWMERTTPSAVLEGGWYEEQAPKQDPEQEKINELELQLKTLQAARAQKAQPVSQRKADNVPAYKRRAQQRAAEAFDDDEDVF